MEALCRGCDRPFNYRGPGHYFCEDCRLDDYGSVRNAKENPNTGGFTTTPLTQPLRGPEGHQ